MTSEQEQYHNAPEFKVVFSFSDYEISKITSDIRRRGKFEIKKHDEKFLGYKRIELSKERCNNLPKDRCNRSVAYLMYTTFIGTVPDGKKIYLKNGRDNLNFGIDDIEALTKEEKAVSDKKYRKQLLDDGWKEHPTYKNHLANEAGQVFGLYRGKLQTGHVRADGYVDLGVDGKTKSYHRFVWEACHDRIIPDGHDIDHINEDTQDNRLCNLQLLTRPEHNAKTFADTPQRRQIRSERASKAIIRQKVLGNGLMGDVEDFSSQLVAGEETGLDRREIAKHMGTVWKGYLWNYRPVEEIQGEIWKTFEDIEVSNKGRLKRDSIVSRGRLNREGGEYMFYKDRKKLFVKTIVCRVYNGPPPAGDKSPEVRHLDKNIGNNNADNLVWSTHQEGAENSKKVNSIIAYFTDNKAIYHQDDGEYIFKTATAASKYFKIDSKNIGTICREGTRCKLKNSDGRNLDFLYLKDTNLDTRSDGKLYLESTTRVAKPDKRYRENKMQK